MTEQSERGRRTPPAGPTNQELVPMFDKAKKLIDTYSGALTRVMPRHANAETFFGLAIAAVRKDPKLIAAVDANPQSFLLALRECAYLGHVVTRNQFYLLPFNNSKAPGQKEIVGIEAYQGLMQRMFRAGGVHAINVDVGRANDPVLRFKRSQMPLPQHEYDEFAPPTERGPLKVAYAWATLLDGSPSAVSWMPQHEITRRRASSRSGDAFWGPIGGEGPNTETMWKKSALLGLESMVPVSAEYREQIGAQTAAAIEAFPNLGDPTIPTDVVWEGEVVES